MPRRYRPREVIGFLESLGFSHDRTRGDHYIMKATGHSVTVQLRPRGGTTTPRDLASIARQAGYSPKDFRAMLDTWLGGR